MTRTLAVVVSLLAALVSVPVVSAPALAARAERDTATTARGGAAGTRTVIVRRGVNVVDKSGWSGELADPMLTRDAVRELAALGFTTLRLGFTWDSSSTAVTVSTGATSPSSNDSWTCSTTSA